MHVDPTGHALPLDEQQRVSDQMGERPRATVADRVEPSFAAIDEEPTDSVDLIEGRLDAVERALARLDDGTYGQCETCGAQIEDALIEADPVLTSCSACARQEHPTA